MKILSRSFYAEILALQGFPAGLRASYFIRDKSGYPEFRNNQTFSIAGSRKGFGDPRGTLFFELARLAEARKPSYLLFENVPYALLHIRYIMSCKQLCKVSSYYKVVVIKVPLQGQNATIDKVLWIGLNLLPQDGLRKAPTTALCF